MGKLQHGNIGPGDLTPADPLGRGVHPMQGFKDTAHEGTRKDIDVLAIDVGRSVLQTAGAVPGIYVAHTVGKGLDKWRQIGGDVTTQAVDLLVRTVGGDDTASGASGAPLKTLAEAVARIPFHIAKGHPVIIRLGDGAYPRPAWGTRILGDHLAVRGDGAGVGDGFNRLQTSETADTGTGAAVVKKIGGGLTPDAFRGKTIRTLTGPGAGQRRTISSNSATDIIPAVIFIPAPDNTTTYEIVEDTVVWDYPAGEYVELAGSGNSAPETSSDGKTPAYVVSQVRFDVAAGGASPTIFGATLALYGIEVSGAGTFVPHWQNLSLFCGFDNAFSLSEIPLDLGFATDSFQWGGWGMAQVGPVSPVIRHAGLKAMAVLVQGSLLAEGPDSTWHIHGGRLFGKSGADTLQASDGAVVRLIPTVPIQIEATGADQAVEANENSSIFLVTASLSAAAALIRARRSGYLSVDSTVTGTSSAGLAIDATLGGIVHLHGAPAVDGAVPAAAFDPGGGGAVAKGFFTATGDYTANADGSVIERVS